MLAKNLADSTRASLEEVAKVAQLTADNVVSIGASLSHVHVPGRGTEEIEDAMKQDEIELGMGIHNEPGSERISTSLSGLVKMMLAHMLDTKDHDRSFLKVLPEDSTVLLVNNLGAVSVLELGGITAEVTTQLKSNYRIKPVRVLSGTFMTSLNGLGFSISLLRLSDTRLGSGRGMLELLDAPSEAVGWSSAVRTETWNAKRNESKELDSSVAEPESKPSNIKSEFCVIRDEAN
jgi:dihydroxyacetone kinase